MKRLIIIVFALWAQIALINENTYRQDINEIGDVVCIVDDNHQFTKWEIPMFKIIKIPGTKEEVRDALNKMLTGGERRSKYPYRIDTTKTTLDTKDLATCVTVKP